MSFMPGDPSKTTEDGGLDAILQKLVTPGVSAEPLPSAIKKPANKDVPLQEQVKAYEKKLQAAYPDQKITVTLDPVTGAISGDIADAPRGQPTFATPNFDIKQSSAGFDLYKDQLAKATTSEEKLNIAMNLKRLVQDTMTFNYNKYSQQASEQFGITDLLMSIEQYKKIEATDPNRPPGAIMSDQRQALYEQLAQARIAAREQTKELMSKDQVVNQANNLADSILNQFKLADDVLRLNEMDAAKAAQKQMKVELLQDPARLNRIAAATTGSIKPDDATRDRIATQMSTGKLKLDPFTEVLSKASQDQLITTILDPKVTPIDKQKIRNILISDEIAATGDEAKAKENIKLLDSVLNAKLDDPNNIGLNLLANPELQGAINKRNKILADKAKMYRTENTPAGVQKEERAGIDIETRKQLLQIISNDRFNSDVYGWKGLIQANPTAMAVLAAGDRTKPMDSRSFITNFMNYNDGKNISEKVAVVRELIATAATAAQTGSVLPNPNPQSMSLLADRIAVASIVRPFAIENTTSWEDFQNQYRKASESVARR